MNKDNLKRIVEHLKTIDEEQFDMKHFIARIGNISYDEIITCGTSACAIGHCVVLDTELFKKCYDIADKKYSLSSGSVYRNSSAYIEWSQEFTGLSVDSREWLWCFGTSWSSNPETNTVEHCISRIEALLDDKPRDYNLTGMELHEDYEYFYNWYHYNK